jgi:hypothetical protein
MGDVSFVTVKDEEPTYGAGSAETIDQGSDEVCAAADTRGIKDLALKRVSR